MNTEPTYLRELANDLLQDHMLADKIVEAAEVLLAIAEEIDRSSAGG